ncbi:unnamed protein product [Adineta ricciae]|uniref:Uncharacterized protein n=1 Tax=Adineta ricciae TaxID=249248 RepID=A0A815PCW7_ADIRI|nr:unnamed protein product [Adineta ricciae]CAF1447284.1 unnamed protein product [Adineta ricciae]
MQNIFTKSNNEYEKLIDTKKSYYDGNNKKCSNQSTSYLEWAESSWTRWLHLICWWWIKPLLSIAYTRSLNENDLDDLPYNDKSSILLNRFESYDWTNKPIWKIIFTQFRKEHIYVGLLHIPFILTRIIQPLLVRQIVLKIISHPKSFITIYIYAILLFIFAILNTIFYRQSDFLSIRIGIRIRNSFLTMIYKQLILTKLTILQQMNTGYIINIINQDTKKLEQAFSYIHKLWQGPMEAIIIFGLLCWIMKPIPTLIGFIIMIISIVIQCILCYKIGKYCNITTSFSDKRVHAFNELIHNCDIIKMYNWEKLIQEQIYQLRQNELDSIRCASRFRALYTNQFFVSTSILAFVTFSSTWLLNYSIDSINIFTTLAFFSLIRDGFMYSFPDSLEKLTVAQLASKRIQSLLMLTMQHEEKYLPSISSINNSQQVGGIFMKNASFSWSNDQSCLSSLNVTIESGSLIGIVGSVGSGKSSFLQAILGEINLINGQIDTTNSSFAYSAQIPWIFVDTLRNNILLNQVYDEQRYKDIIYATCLDIDIQLLGLAGDLTMIGERGKNLSGGQRTRVSLARALYTNADIYLFDDPLAAVDQLVAKQIFDRCFGPNGLLKNKTRLLVTHQTQFLRDAHQIIYLSQGQIYPYDYLNQNKIIEKQVNNPETSDLLSDVLNDKPNIEDIQSIIVEEKPLNTKNISWSLWYHLFTSPPLHISGLFSLIILFILTEIFYDGTNYWLSKSLKQFNTYECHSINFISSYFILTIITVLINLLCLIYFYYIILNGTNYFHNKMVKGLLYTSMQFFESNPSGRNLNRASKDQEIIDELLPRTLLTGLLGLITLIGSFVILCFTSPYLLLLLLILIPIFLLLFHYYQTSLYQLKQFESKTRSPISNHVMSSLNGTVTIRALKVQNYFIYLFTNIIDRNTNACTNIYGALNWFSFRLEFMGALIMFVATILVILFHNQIDPSRIAFTLAYAISVSYWPQRTIRKITEADILMTSVERINEYGQLTLEEDYGGDQKLIITSETWPNNGKIQFDNYSVCYRIGLEPVLKNLSIEIKPGEKIGIIGRTGAGKSSLFKSILRFLPRININGIIFIDDIDISRITLNHLRSHLSVIPQQSILFNGTLRYNLDPFNQYSDEQCWMSLEDVQLKQFVSNQTNGLLMNIAESGSNLSVGQCQLICIARAVLKKSKILLIDEATANIDHKTDEKIQDIIAKKFQDRTVLTIAHRLNTVMRSDRILVLDKGFVVNFDIPSNIFQ